MNNLYDKIMKSRQVSANLKKKIMKPNLILLNKMFLAKQDCVNVVPFIFTRSNTMWLFLVLKLKICLKENIWGHGAHDKKYNGAILHHIKRRACQRPRGLFWRKVIFLFSSFPSLWIQLHTLYFLNTPHMCAYQLWLKANVESLSLIGIILRWGFLICYDFSCCLSHHNTVTRLIR